MLAKDLPEYSVVADGANERFSTSSVSAVDNDGHLESIIFIGIHVNGHLNYTLRINAKARENHKKRP